MDDEYKFLQKIYARHNYSAHYGSVFHVKISGRSNLCERGMMYRFLKFKKVDEGEAHTQFWLAVTHVRSWSTRRNRASSLRAPSQVHLETDSNSRGKQKSLKSRDVKKLLSDVRRWAQGLQRNAFFFLQFLGTKVELGKAFRIASQKALRGRGRGEQMRKTCICRLRKLQFCGAQGRSVTTVSLCS